MNRGRFSKNVTLQLEGIRLNDRLLELPSWNSHWNRLVYPLLVADERQHLFPIGTAFRFSDYNHVLTALHNLECALLAHHPHRERVVQAGLAAVAKQGDLTHSRLVIINQGPNPLIGNVTLEIRQFSSVHASPPADLLVGTITTNEHSARVPYILPTVSFAPPRIGEVVHCIGYADMAVPADGLSIEGLQEGWINPYEHYTHRLMCISGRVTCLFGQRFSNGFVKGPCFAIDVEVPHGMSGGPVLREDGVVCGVIAAGATSFFASPATVASLLYPLYALGVDLKLTMGNGVLQLTAQKRPVFELVSTRAIRTDGAERQQIHVTPEPEGLRVGIAYHEDDMPHVFDDFAGYCERLPPQSLPADAVLKTIVPNFNNPLVRSRHGLK